MRLGRGSVEILFVLLSLLGAISCLARPDYNLPLFAFMWWVFFHVNDDRKHRHQRYMLIFVLASCVQDILYLFYWTPKWFSADWLEISDATENIHVAVSLTSLLEVIIKSVLLMILLAPNCVDFSTDAMCDCCGKEDRIEEYEFVTYE